MSNFLKVTPIEEALEIIDEHLSVDFRSDYLRIRDGTYVPKPRREQIIEEVTQILKDHGYEEG